MCLLTPPIGNSKKQTAHGESFVKGFSDMGSIPIISTNKKDHECNASVVILIGGVVLSHESNPREFQSLDFEITPRICANTTERK